MGRVVAAICAVDVSATQSKKLSPRPAVSTPSALLRSHSGWVEFDRVVAARARVRRFRFSSLGDSVKLASQGETATGRGFRARRGKVRLSASVSLLGKVLVLSNMQKSVLVVDDDPDLLGLVQLLLEGVGYRVITAGEGQEALSRVAEKMPDLILLDMKMPGMNGWDFARAFRQRYDRAAPIVVLTAAEDARKRAEEIGAEGYLGKPFDIDELIRIVERNLDRHNGHR